MKKALFLFLVLSLFNFAFAQHDGNSLANAKVGHDASHRVGKLVDTGKVDDMFLKNMSSIEVKNLSHTDNTAPAYSVVISAGAGNAQVLLKFDMTGKFLPPQVVTGQSNPQENAWEVDSSEILEAALHWVQSAVEPGVNFTEFSMKLGKAVLKQQKNDDGSIQPVVQLSSETSAKTLQVVLSSKGEFVSYSIVE